MGRLEVFYNDTWGTVCDDFFSSDDARVACGMLNYTDALCSVPNAQFGEGEGNSSGVQYIKGHFHVCSYFLNLSYMQIKYLTLELSNRLINSIWSSPV